jgi:N4-(beta-N-acetylglucosaminyl)-L-asparaginase
MNNRRKFIKQLSGLAALVGLPTAGIAAINNLDQSEKDKKKGTKKGKPQRKLGAPMIVTTWNFGLQANEAAWPTLAGGGRALDAIEQGIRQCENDPTERSVGFGGRPDRDGHVTLDACIMDEIGNIGSVVCMEHIANPISVARAVMEKTPHVMLAGEGATQFAVEQGFEKVNLLVPDSEREWKEWLKKAEYTPVINIENHDTIGMIAMDGKGNLSGGCSTSGMAFKMHGRIGDSPIIGAGLYVDNEVGAVTATGQGEEVIRVVGSFRVVEEMRHGASPQEACEQAVKAIRDKFVLRGKDWSNTQIGFIAINPQGDIGAYALRPGFTYAVKTGDVAEVRKASYLLD